MSPRSTFRSHARAVGWGVTLLAVPLLSVCSVRQGVPVLPTQEEPAEPPTNLYVSTTGSDRNPGTRAAPLRTIQAAANKAKPGTTVKIAGGTYYERVRTRAAGTATAWITYQSDDGQAVVDGSRVPKVTPNQGVFELWHPYSRLLGVKVTHSKNSGIVYQADHLVIARCQVSDVENHGITSHLGVEVGAYPLPKDLEIRGCEVTHTCTEAPKASGQAISVAADGFVVADNQVHANQAEGIDVWLDARHGEVAGNDVWGHTGLVGIYVDGAQYVRIHRNRSRANKSGVTVSSEDPKFRTHHIWVYNNLLYDNSHEGISLWDPSTGATDVVFAFNTLVNNPNTFGFYGSGNTAEITGNLGWPQRQAVADHSEASSYRIHDNVWLSGPAGLHDAEAGDFRLTASSPGRGGARPLEPFVDDRGERFAVTVDFAGAPRPAGANQDAGALGYQAP